MTATTDKLLTITPANSHLLKGERERIWVEMTVTAPPARERKRAPLDLVLVLDRSGSMGPDRFQHQGFLAPRPRRQVQTPGLNWNQSGQSASQNYVPPGEPTGIPAPWRRDPWSRPWPQPYPHVPPYPQPQPYPYVPPQPLPTPSVFVEAPLSKLENAKRAAVHVLEQLGPEDRCAVIVYDSQVQTIHRLSSKHEAAIEKVEAITSGGSTALAPALERALQLLERRSGEDGRARHVFLLSDGQANVGERNPALIADRAAAAARKGIRVATFGLGADYNEELMESVAVAGGGGYYFLESAESAADAFSTELALAFTVSVREATLEFTPAKGVELVRLLGLDADEFPVAVGDIPARATRTVLAELELATGGKAGERELGSVSVRFRKGKEKRFRSEQAPVKVTLTTSERKVAEGVVPRVYGKLAELEAALAQRQAAAYADQGDYASARSVLTFSQQFLSSAVNMAPDLAPMLAGKSAELERDLNAVASDASYGSLEAKRMRASSYLTRSSRS